MDDKLEEVLSKIIRLSKQNEEFGARLRKAIGTESPAAGGGQYDERIEKIEKYLGLDFDVDSKPSTIDYSFVSIDEAREQLVCDNREMMRFRYGTRYHAESFPEYCRYAQLQLEMLLNYYYDQKNGGDLARMKAHIKSFNKTVKVDEAKSLVAIPYDAKRWAFHYERKLAFQLNSTLEHIKDMRNSLSHRSVGDDEFDGDYEDMYDYRQHLTGELGLPLDQNGEVDYFKIKGNPDKGIKGDPVKFDKYEKERKTRNYKLYSNTLWGDREPYDEVAAAVKAVATHVRDGLASGD